MDRFSIVKVSVRELVEYGLKSGDIVSGFTGSSRLVEGTRAHQRIQKAEDEGYTAEVTVSHMVEDNDIQLEISGRIDGVINREGETTIDEIKTTLRSLDSIDEAYSLIHIAQAKCYAYIYSLQNGLDSIKIRLTYYQLESKEIKYFYYSFHISQLKEFFDGLAQKYIHWIRIIKNWSTARDESIAKLNFPFESYRSGQRGLAVSVYKCIREGKKLFAQAPTGTGKTIATAFPAVKAVGEGLISKMFYLTAKTITRTVAEEAFDKMRARGLLFKTLTITAKDKICFKDETICNPEYCEYARGYFDHIDEALEDIFKLDSFTRPVIEEYARKHSVCPFEFSLDISYWADCIICDYNYLFDPSAYLRRFFMDGGGDYAFLIDEAHNLVDRAREMFSAELTKKPFLELKRKINKRYTGLRKSVGDINNYLIDLRKVCENQEEKKDYYVQKELLKDIFPLLRKFIDISEKYLSGSEQLEFKDELMTLYFDVAAFIRAGESYDERYTTFIEKSGSDVKVKLFCIDPSYLLGEAMKRGRSTVLFSATLSPMDYYINILGGDENSMRLKLPSPFPPENLCLLVNDRISTRYKARELTYDSIAESIGTIVSGRKGNYLVYFPSYKYMNEVYARFSENNTDIKIIIQNTGMTEDEREGFLNEFSESGIGTMVGFAVMGGMFGEGIDLSGDRLIGAVIVGVGLPQICLERDIIRRHFQAQNGMGFEYSYMYPGMNKVMQAVGRVIRTETDRGVVLLIDDRFSLLDYRKLFPPEWDPGRPIGRKSMEDMIRRFWSES